MLSGKPVKYGMKQIPSKISPLLNSSYQLPAFRNQQNPKTKSYLTTHRWQLNASSGNWGPALKEWGLSTAKKPGTRTEGVW